MDAAEDQLRPVIAPDQGTEHVRCVSQTSPCVPQEIRGARPAHEGGPPLDEFVARAECEAHRRDQPNNQRPGRRGEVRNNISRTRMAGMKPCAKCPRRS